MKILEIYEKKKVALIAVVSSLALMIAGVSITYAMKQNHKQEVLASIDLTFKDDTYIEYGQERVDFNEYIKEKIGEPEVILPKDEINTKELGKRELIYKIMKDGYSKDASITLEVKDTKAPEIKIKEETVTLEYGSDYDIKSNIESVKDPIDGDIPYAEVAGDSNFYTIEGDVHTSTAGDYTITIKAVDKNDIATEAKDYLVTVEAEVVKPPISKPSSGKDTYTSPVTNGSVSNPPPVSDNGGANTEPNICESNGQWQMISNSGYADYDWATANKWGTSNVADDKYYKVISTKDICGNDGWTVLWKDWDN